MQHIRRHSRSSNFSRPHNTTQPNRNHTMATTFQHQFHLQTHHRNERHTKRTSNTYNKPLQTHYMDKKERITLQKYHSTKHFEKNRKTNSILYKFHYEKISEPEWRSEKKRQTNRLTK